MSRKKLLIKEQLEDFTPITIGDRINYIIASKDLKGRKFCEIMGISSGNLSGLINDSSKPSSGFCEQILEHFNVDLNWLISGKGSPYIKGEKENNGPTADVDPEVNELLNMTRAVIKSNTGYAHSLKANIRSFHDAVETRQEIQDLKQRVAEMEKDRGGNQNGGDTPQSIAPKINNDLIKKSGT